MEYHKSCSVIISVGLSNCFSVNIFIEISGVDRGISSDYYLYILNRGGRVFFSKNM